MESLAGGKACSVFLVLELRVAGICITLNY